MASAILTVCWLSMHYFFEFVLDMYFKHGMPGKMLSIFLMTFVFLIFCGFFDALKKDAHN